MLVSSELLGELGQLGPVLVLVLDAEAERLQGVSCVPLTRECHIFYFKDSIVMLLIFYNTFNTLRPCCVCCDMLSSIIQLALEKH